MRRAGMLVLVLMCFVPSAAHAGTYEVWSCAGPDGRPVPADGWRAEGHAEHSSPSNACAGGGGLYAGLNGIVAHPANQATVTWHFQVPASLKISSYRMWRAAGVQPNTGNASPVYWMARQANAYIGAYVVGGENCPGWQGCKGLGDASNRFAAANLIGEGPLADVRDLFLNAGCGGSNGTACAAGSTDTAWFRMYRAAIKLSDDSDPVFGSQPAGSLLGGVPLAGAHGVSFAATDVGGGLREAVIEVDGKRAAATNLGCAPPYTRVVPCKLAASGTVTLNTATLADGAHSVRVLVTDVSGNSAAFGPFPITTSNAPTSCAPAAAPNLTTSLSRRGTIGYGGRLFVRGQLAGAAAGTQVQVFSQVARAGAPQKRGRTPLVTDAEGRFTYRVPAGPSRTLRFSYRNAGDPSLACSKPVAVKVRAPVSLRATPRSIRSGQRVRFRGKLRGGYIPAEGKLVELQAFERGRWRNLRNVRTNSKGAFSYRYRFSFRAAGVTFPVRARVRADSGYPFALGTSKRVKVRVR